MALLILSTILPIAIISLKATSGQNNVSNDDFMKAPIVDQALHGIYQWKDIFRDTFHDGHCGVLPVLATITNAWLTRWNVHFLILFGIFLAILKLILFYNIFTLDVGSRWRWLLLPALSALTFSASQLSTFEFNFGTLQISLNQLGIVLGVWGLVRWPGRWTGICIMTLGGFIACWSWGSGPLVWPVYLIGLIILGFRRVSQYILWFFSFLASSFPYFFFLILKPLSNPYETKPPHVRFLNFPTILGAIGWPLTQAFSNHTAMYIGICGLALGALGFLILLFAQLEKGELRRVAPPLMLVLFSLLNIYQISLFRETLSPWYSSPLMVFWIGLTGLAFAFWAHSPSLHQHPPAIRSLLPRLWSICFWGFLIFFYSRSNLTYADKSYFLKTQTPASISCLLDHNTAPTYCEPTLFTWILDHYEEFPEMTTPVAKNQLSVFTPQRERSMQGDMILSSVHFHDVPEFPENFWSAENDTKPQSFWDHRRLNLSVHSPNSVSWTLSLPPGLKKAEFHSAVALGPSIPMDPKADGLTAQVSATSGDKPAELLWDLRLPPDQGRWHPINIDLKKFVGQTITLSLTSNPMANTRDDWVIYRYPHVKMFIEQGQADPALKGSIQPINTDLSPNFPKSSDLDFIFKINHPEYWVIRNMETLSPEIGRSRAWRVGQDPQMEYQAELKLCLGQYSHLSVQLAVSPDIKPRLMQVFFRLEGQSQFDEKHSFFIPLLRGGEMRSYSYDLNLLEGDRRKRLIGLRLDPVLRGNSSGEDQVQIFDLRLIQSAAPKACQ
ncbi:MAG: hypothetical protein U1F66_05330 [bacterium]